MKKFFKNPYNLAWVISIGVVVVFTIVASFVPVLFRVDTFLIGAVCIYSGVLLIMARRNNNIDLDEFTNESDIKKSKKSFAQSEGKINRILFISSLFIVGVIFIYLTFK